MLRKIAYKNSNRFVSKWIIFGIDLIIVTFSIQVAYLLRFNFQLDFVNKYPLGWQFIIVISTYVTGFLISKPFSGIIRHTSLKDLEKLLIANITALILGLSFNILFLSSENWNYYRIPLSIFIIQFLMVTFLMTFLRFFVKNLYRSLVRSDLKKKRVLIYGAGEIGLITKHVLERDEGCAYQILAFVDDNASKVGKNLEGLPVLGVEKIQSFINASRIQEIIIAIQKIGPLRKKEIVDSLIDFNVAIKNIPPVGQWINGEFSSRQIKHVKIEDLLGRAPIKLDQKLIRDELEGKVVLVTGAAGSIGSEIVRQVISYSPRELILIDQAESPLHDLVVDLRQCLRTEQIERLKSHVCDVTNSSRVAYLLSKYRPDVIYHVAAYKHVPLMEHNPSEAVEVNVFGTKNIADLAMKNGVSRFVLVSTDKAVNPTNIMGASKRIAEMYCQALDCSTTRFITTRFGNVLGSNGSVIPLFKKQIEQGGPLTVTHPEITRFFMTIPEACELVLEAGAMGEGGEIFVFDMGEPIKIYELAKKMIRLSGFSDEEIGIEITGLRPGEKLYEEVLSLEENIKRTYHPKISIANIRRSNKASLDQELEELEDFLFYNDDKGLVYQIMKIVPEFRSSNIDYKFLNQKLDSLDSKNEDSNIVFT